MKISRIIYGLLTAALTWAYFMPWLIDHGQNFPGWATVLFSFFYFVGVSIAIVIFFTGYRAVGLSIFAGVIMIASNLLTGIFLGLSAAMGIGQLGAGFELAFITSLVYLILGPICGSKFETA
ncbi:MAG: hypothetical protein KGI59_02185 [Patescibacteria group bacterium]|nr:hypothetical protein [Patescibacteria group bacterium]